MRIQNIKIKICRLNNDKLKKENQEVCCNEACIIIRFFWNLFFKYKYYFYFSEFVNIDIIYFILIIIFIINKIFYFYIFAIFDMKYGNF